MPLTIQTIEELENKVRENKDNDWPTFTLFYGQMEALLSAARWALENGYQEESESEVVDSPEVNMAKVFMNGFEVTYAKDGESVAIDQPNSSSQDGRKG